MAHVPLAAPRTTAPAPRDWWQCPAGCGHLAPRSLQWDQRGLQLLLNRDLRWRVAGSSSIPIPIPMPFPSPSPCLVGCSIPFPLAAPVLVPPGQTPRGLAGGDGGICTVFTLKV